MNNYNICVYTQNPPIEHKLKMTATKTQLYINYAANNVSIACSHYLYQ